MKFNKIKKINSAKQKGGLCLTSCNMDKGAPFHAKWKNTNKACENFPKIPNNTYAWLQEGGLKKKSKKQKGGLSLKSCNMDDGAPYHPVWHKNYNNCNKPPTPPKE